MLNEIMCKLMKVVFKKDNGAKEMIVEVGLVVIAVFLLLVFRGSINTLITTIISSAQTAIDNLF